MCGTIELGHRCATSVLDNVECNYFNENAWIQKIHYNDVIMGAMASQITSLTIVYSKVYSGADQREHQSSESLASVRGIHRGPVNSPHKWTVTRKRFPFDDVIMNSIVICESVELLLFRWWLGLVKNCWRVTNWTHGDQVLRRMYWSPSSIL